MPLVFLVPALLAGLAALAGPVLLHLRRRERERPMRFPSLMFLRRVTITTARRRRITDLPLLLVRLAIVTLAVLAFARPVIRPRPSAVAPRGSRRVVVAIDRSMSMGHLAVWPAARDSARSVIEALASGDRVAIVSFDEDAAIEQPLTLDHAAALAAIDRLHPGSRGTRFGAGIRAAREVLAREADVRGGEIDVITDLQRVGAAGISDLTVPDAVHVRAINVSLARHGNSAVVATQVQRLAGSDTARSRLVVLVRVASNGLGAPRPVTVTLSANGRVAAEKQATLAPDGSTTVDFDPLVAPVGSVRLVAAITHDSLTADDEFNVVVPAQLTRRVILAAPADARPDATLYLERALETGTDPQLQIERRNVGSVDAAMLRDAIAVVLDDVPTPSGAAGTALAAWIHDGGGLITVAGPRLAARGGSPDLPAAATHGMVDRTADAGGVLGAVSLEHPVFASWKSAASASVGGVRFFRYPRLVPASDAQIVARFDDGSPALVERQEGLGKVLTTAMALDATSGDFPLQPTYLPFLRSLVLYAGGRTAAPLWRTAGDPWPVPISARNPVVQAPSGKLIRPAGGAGTSVPLDEAGLYRVYEARPSGDPLAVVAVNPPAAESDLASMPATELLVGVGQDSVGTHTADAASLIEADRRQRLWRILLIAAGCLLLGELIMTSLGWRGSAAAVVGVPSEGSVP
jgi:hypothetical protein